MTPTARPDPQTIQWRRLTAESAAILVSILLAFAIDAWWDGHQQRTREYALLTALQEDFAASRPLLEARVVLAQRMSIGNDLLLAALAAADEDAPLSVPDSLILAVISGPTYEPSTSSLDAALASGEIDILRGARLRAELATWRRLLADTAEDELEVRRITNEQVVPQLAQSVGLQRFFDTLLSWTDGDLHGSGITVPARDATQSRGHASIIPTTELEGALAMRKFYVDFSAADLQALLASLDRIAELLEPRPAA